MKSQKAKEFIEKWEYDGHSSYKILNSINAEKAVELAEQEMIEKAKWAYIENCTNRSYSENNDRYECEIDFEPCDRNCIHYQGFINQLNIQL